MPIQLEFMLQNSYCITSGFCGRVHTNYRKTWHDHVSIPSGLTGLVSTELELPYF